MSNITTALISLLVVCSAGSAFGGVEAEVEAGWVFTSRNATRIPGKGGTDLSLVDDLSTDPAPAFRVRAGYRIAGRHLVSALYAPLQINARGTAARHTRLSGRRVRRSLACGGRDT